MRQIKPGQLQSGSLYPISASYALTASYTLGLDTGSLVTTASFNSFTSSYYVDSSSVSTRVTNLENFSSSLDATFATDAELNAATASLSASISSLSSNFDAFSGSYNTGSFTGSFIGDGSQLTGIVSSKWSGSNPISRQSDVEITGSLRVQGSITGSLFGTASWATNAQTASYVNPLNQNVQLTGSIYLSTPEVASIYFSGSAAASRLTWNNTDGTLDLGLKGGNVTLQVGQEQVARVVNKTATNINLLEANYQAVRITGAQGQRLKVDLAQATNDALSADTIGLVTETINNNQEGFITTAGLVRGINTTGTLQGETWADGDVVYLSPTTAGNITNIKPVAPNHLIIIGFVVSAHITQGSIFVKVDNGYEIDELHNVRITTASLAAGQLLVRSGSNATGVWVNTNQLTGSYGLTGSLTATSFTGSLFGTASWANNAVTAQTASYVLNAISSSFASTASFVQTAQTASYVLNAVTASHALQANNILPIGGDKQAGFISYVNTTGSFQSVKAYHRFNIDIAAGGATTINLTGSLIASSITSSLQGTASFSNTSTSASYSLTASYLDNYIPPFPYTGSAIISGSLTVIDGNQCESINTELRRLFDINGLTSIDWDTKDVFDGNTTPSINWDSRILFDTNGNSRIGWAYIAGGMEVYAYTRNYFSGDINEDLANQSNYATYLPTGEIIQGVTFDNVVVDYDLVYLDTDNTWYPVDMTTSSSINMLGIAYDIGNTNSVLIEGTTVVNDSALTDSPQVSSIQAGTPIYVNTTTAGIFMSTTVPSTAGNYVRLLGYAYYQSVEDSQYWLMKFKPSNDWYEI